MNDESQLNGVENRNLRSEDAAIFEPSINCSQLINNYNNVTNSVNVGIVTHEMGDNLYNW
jgi:hypothetical protein